MTDALAAAAIAARAQAHAPYSHFAVGAALRCDDGRVFAGCNVENAAYPEGLCAEAAALAAMVLGGGRRVAEMVIAAGSAAPCTPCGGCRQKLREFAGPATTVRCIDARGATLLVRSLAELLPESFGPDHLA